MIWVFLLLFFVRRTEGDFRFSPTKRNKRNAQMIQSSLTTNFLVFTSFRIRVRELESKFEKQPTKSLLPDSLNLKYNAVKYDYLIIDTASSVDLILPILGNTYFTS